MGNHVLRLRLLVTVKLNFRPYVRRYTSPNENFEYSYPLSIQRIKCHVPLFIFLQALEEEETMTPEQLAIKNVGKQVGHSKTS